MKNIKYNQNLFFNLFLLIFHLIFYLIYTQEMFPKNKSPNPDPNRWADFGYKCPIQTYVK